MDLLPRADAHVTERGIIFQGRQYHSKTYQHQNSMALARAKGHWTVQIAFDYRTTNHIYVKVDHGTYIPYYLSKNDLAYANRDFVKSVF